MKIRLYNRYTIIKEKLKQREYYYQSLQGKDPIFL